MKRLFKNNLFANCKLYAKAVTYYSDSDRAQTLPETHSAVMGRDGEQKSLEKQIWDYFILVSCHKPAISKRNKCDKLTKK